MKKVLIAAVIVLAVLIGIIAVDAVKKQNEETVTQVNRYTDGNVQVTEIVEYPTKDPDATVQFSMPLHYLEEKYRNDLDLFCKENGYIACTIDEQAQIFTVTANALQHDMSLVRIGMQSITNIGNEIESEKYPFFKELGAFGELSKYDFSEITVFVDKAGYESAADKDSFMAYIAGCGIYYQLYTTSNDYSCKIIVRDVASKESVLDAKLFEQNNSGVVA